MKTVLHYSFKELTQILHQYFLPQGYEVENLNFKSSDYSFEITVKQTKPTITFTIPVNTLNPQQAKEQLKEIMQQYQQKLDISNIQLPVSNSKPESSNEA